MRAGVAFYREREGRVAAHQQRKLDEARRVHECGLPFGTGKLGMSNHLKATVKLYNQLEKANKTSSSGGAEGDGP